MRSCPLIVSVTPGPSTWRVYLDIKIHFFVPLYLWNYFCEPKTISFVGIFNDFRHIWLDRGHSAKHVAVISNYISNNLFLLATEISTNGNFSITTETYVSDNCIYNFVAQYWRYCVISGVPMFLCGLCKVAVKQLFIKVWRKTWQILVSDTLKYCCVWFYC